MGNDTRSTKAGYRILLIAMMIQGLTPDHGGLTSSWLLRLVYSGLSDPRSTDGNATPSPIPVPRGQDDGVPDEDGWTVIAEVTPCVRLNTGGRPCVHHLSVGPVHRSTRSASRSLRFPNVVMRGSEGVILSLCRFLC